MADDLLTQDPPAAPVAPPAAPPAAPPSDWRAGLTGEHATLAQEKSLEGFKGKDWTEVGPALAKAFVETKKLVGAKTPALVVPGPTATPEERAAYHKAIGVPATAAEYTPVMREVPPGEEWDDSVVQTFLGRMHQAGATPSVVQAMIDARAEYLNGLAAANRREAEATAQGLRREWGPNYDAQLGRANRAIQQYGGNAVVDLFAGNGMGRHPLIVQMFAKIGADLVEHGAMTGPTATGVSPEEAQAHVTTLQADLLKVPQGSDRAKEIIEQISTYTNLARGGRR